MYCVFVLDVENMYRIIIYFSGGQVVVGSNPAVPTNIFNNLRYF